MDSKIMLVKVTKFHLAWIMQQRNRPELMKYFRQTGALAYKDQMEWWYSLNPKKVRLYMLHDGQDFVGYVGLNPIDARHKHAEFGIFVVPEHQKEGYAKDGLMRLLDVGFTEMGLHKIYSDVLDYPGENRFDFYRHLGFKEEGRLKQHYFKDGKWVDAIQFAMFGDEYRKLKDQLEPRKQTKPVAEKVEVLG